MKHSRVPSEPGYEYDFFAGGNTKTGSWAIYFNLAVSNRDRLLKQLQDKSWNETQQQNYLAEFLWKAHKLSRNSNGYQLSGTDRLLIKELNDKLDHLRNYHAHVWHDNKVLAFTKQLKEFVETRYHEALYALALEFPKDVIAYEELTKPKGKEVYPLFIKVDNKFYITSQGRVFFLSFYLSSGQMSQLLQQTRFYKRTDMPEYRLKHKLYKYYCHRDGASIADFNHEESVFYSLDPQLQQNIKDVRQAYKLISYLNDFPHFWGESGSMPLFTERNGTFYEIKDVLQLQSYIREHRLLGDFVFEAITMAKRSDSSDNPEKEHEDLLRKATIAFRHQELPGYHFYIDFDTFHRLVVMVHLNRQGVQPDPVEILTGNLRKHTANRAALSSILIKSADDRTAEDLAYLAERSHRNLRGLRWLTTEGIKVFDNIDKGRKNEKSSKLIDCIRAVEDWSREFPEDYPEPVMVYRQDLLDSNERKFRPENRFVWFAAHYLMQSAIGKDWYWCVEKFELEKKNDHGDEVLNKNKQYLKGGEVPPDFRLTVEDNHVFIGLPKKEAGTRNYQKFHQVSIGPKAMQYLMLALEKNEKGFAGFANAFFDKVRKEMDDMAIQGANYSEALGQLLEDKYVPSYLKPGIVAEQAVKQLKAKLHTRVEFIISRWDKYLSDPSCLSRAEQNRVVMEAYRFFDWPRDKAGVPKYFRKNEYNQMSVCHYLLQEKGSAKLSEHSYRNRRNNNKFIYLFETLFDLKNRKPGIPVEIIGHLDKAATLRELLINVLRDRRTFLKEQLDTLTQLQSQKFKKECAGFCSKMGIALTPAMRSTENQDKLFRERVATFERLPFPLHPMLIVKHFFPGSYKTGDDGVKQGTNHLGPIKQRECLSLAKDIRKNPQLQKGLVKEFYDVGIAQQFYNTGTQKKAYEKLVGLQNRQLTEDMILFWVAQRYLVRNSFTEEMGKALMDAKSGDYHVGKLHDKELNIKLDDNKSSPLYTTVRMHQLDDLMYATQKSQLYKAARHYITRSTIEFALWKNTEQWQDNMDLPDGSASAPVPFETLRRELNLVHRTGAILADKLFDFEKRVLAEGLDRLAAGNKTSYQDILKRRFVPKKAGDFFHLNFEAIIDLAKALNIENVPELESIMLGVPKYRNHILHDDVPVTNGSYSWIVREGTPLREILGVHEDLHQKKDRTAYIVSQS